ncbi:MAG: preprotein translocase subunit SecE [Actinobacteria bacterium]|nr:preprotein translocase subunit SecE [Actinomycetota bacterium]
MVGGSSPSGPAPRTTRNDRQEGTVSEARGDARLSIFGRLALFIRQVVAELRKVIWPTRKELVTYTIVVVVFVLAMAAIVAGFDFVFTRGVLLIFG